MSRFSSRGAALPAALGLLLMATASCSGAASRSSAAAASPVIASLELAGVPGAASTGPDGLWIADYKTGTISKVSGQQPLRLATVQIGDPVSLQPGCVPDAEDAPAGSFIIRRCDLPAGVAVGAGSVWTARNDAEAVVRIDPATQRVLATIPVGMHVFNLVASDTQVWVTAYEDNLIARIDPATNTVVLREPLHGPSGLILADGSVWISTTGDAAVVRLDPKTGAVLATIPVGRVPFPIAAAPGAIWVRCEQDSQVWRIDPMTNQAVATIPVDPFSGTDGLDSMVAVSTGVWISGLQLQWIDATTNRIAGSLRAGGRPYLAGTGRLWIIDAAGRVSLVRWNR